MIQGFRFARWVKRSDMKLTSDLRNITTCLLARSIFLSRGLQIFHLSVTRLVAMMWLLSRCVQYTGIPVTIKKAPSPVRNIAPRVKSTSFCPEKCPPGNDFCFVVLLMLECPRTDALLCWWRQNTPGVHSWKKWTQVANEQSLLLILRWLLDQWSRQGWSYTSIQSSRKERATAIDFTRSRFDCLFHVFCLSYFSMWKVGTLFATRPLSAITSMERVLLKSSAHLYPRRRTWIPALHLRTRMRLVKMLWR